MRRINQQSPFSKARNSTEKIASPEQQFWPYATNSSDTMFLVITFRRVKIPTIQDHVWSLIKLKQHQIYPDGLVIKKSPATVVCTMDTCRGDQNETPTGTVLSPNNFATKRKTKMLVSEKLEWISFERQIPIHGLFCSANGIDNFKTNVDMEKRITSIWIVCYISSKHTKLCTHRLMHPHMWMQAERLQNG